MRIKRKSPFSGKVHEMDLPVTEDELAHWASGALAQNVWPHLSPDQREFIMTGITPEEWDETFKESDGPEDAFGDEPEDLFGAEPDKSDKI